MPKIKERPFYRIKYQYELIQAITGQSKRAIRQAMKRKGLSNDENDFVAYILTFLNKKRRV